MINGMPIYSKGQMSNYFIRQFSKSKISQNVQSNNEIISDKEGIKSPIRSVYHRIAKGTSIKTKFRTSKNSPDRLYKYQDRKREMNNDSKVISKEPINNQRSQIHNIFSTSKIKESSGLDYLFMNKIQKLQNKALVNSNNQNTYSNLLSHIPNTIRLDNSQHDANVYSHNQKYHSNRDEVHSAFDNDDLNKETKKTLYNNNSLALNINSNSISPRIQSANTIQTPNDNNNLCDDIINRSNINKDKNAKEYHLIKSKSSPNNSMSDANHQMYLKYSNVYNQNVNKSSKASGIFLPFGDMQTKMNKNLSSDIITRITSQTKNNSRKQSAEKNCKPINQIPFIQSLEINNINLSTKAKSGLLSLKSADLIKLKDNLYNTKQSFYSNSIYLQGKNNISNVQMVLNDPLNRNIQKEFLRSSQFNLTSKHFMNKNEIKYFDYVTSNIKNHSFKNSSLNSKEIDRKEEKEKGIFHSKLMSFQQNKYLTTVQSKQNSKSLSGVEEYSNSHNAIDIPNNQIININNSNNSLTKNNYLSNINELLISNKSPSGIGIKKHSLQLDTHSPVNKSNKELVLYHKDKIDSLKKKKHEKMVSIQNNPMNIEDEYKHLEIEQLIGNERVLNETNQSMQSTVREAIFYLNEKEKVADYIRKYYSLNGVYPDSQFHFYKYGRLIGKGAFGKVNLALHIGSGRLVAIKSFNKTKLRSKNAIPKIRHEINVLSKLQHPFISQILDTFDTEKHIMIIMEYICGDLLSFIRKRAKLSENSAKIIFSQLIEGLKFIHSNKIVHRDIKLDNILIDLNNTVKICDFGVSRKLNPGDIMHEHCGTPAYIAPEIFKKKGYEGYSCDIWSAGVTLYYMLSGTQPFKGSNVSDLKGKVISGKFEKIKQISQEANDLIEGMLQVNPKKRLTINQILSHPWVIGVNIKERNHINLFTKAEALLLKKFNVNYLNSNRDEMIEYFTNKNIETIVEEERKQKGNTKSYILAPYNSDESNDSILFSDEIKFENSICKFDLKIKLINMKYELNNNEEIDNGAIITQKNSNDNLNYSHQSINSAHYSLSKPISPKSEFADDIHFISGSNSPIGMNNQLFIGNHQESTIRKHIIKEISNTLGYEVSYVIDCLTQKKINYATETYHLLEKDYKETLKSEFR